MLVGFLWIFYFSIFFKVLFNQVNVDFHVEAEKKCGGPDENIAWRWANWAIRAHRVDVRLLKGGESTSTWGPPMGHSWSIRDGKIPFGFFGILWP